MLKRLIWLSMDYPRTTLLLVMLATLVCPSGQKT